MAFTVQDDTGDVENANAYISVAFFNGYHTDRGQLPAELEDTDIQAAIVLATDYLDQRFKYIGWRQQVDQPTEWPRYDAYDIDDNVVIGIPIEVQEATAEYALIALTTALNPSPTRDDTGRHVQMKSERVGPISETITYAQGAHFKMPEYPVADRKLTSRGLTKSRRTFGRG